MIIGDSAVESICNTWGATYYRRHLADGTHTPCFAVENETGAIVGRSGICYQGEMPSPGNPTGTDMVQ